MKDFKETFDLIVARIHNLKGMLKTLDYCIKTGTNVEYFKDESERYKKELDALILQDSQLRDFIIKETYGTD